MLAFLFCNDLLFSLWALFPSSSKLDENNPLSSLLVPHFTKTCVTPAVRSWPLTCPTLRTVWSEWHGYGPAPVLFLSSSLTFFWIYFRQSLWLLSLCSQTFPFYETVFPTKQAWTNTQHEHQRLRGFKRSALWWRNTELQFVTGLKVDRWSVGVALSSNPIRHNQSLKWNYIKNVQLYNE